MDSYKLTTDLCIDTDTPRSPGGARAALPASPCINVCKLDEHQVCIGCRRTMDEIVAWPRMSRQEKVSLLAVLAVRHSAAEHS